MGQHSDASASRLLGLNGSEVLAAEVAQADLVLSGADLQDADLDRAGGRDRSAGGADRTRAAVDGWLGARSRDWLAQIGTVALDPWRGYASALVAPLGHARVVVDHLHVIRLANAVVDQVRRRTQQATLGHRGRKLDPLHRIRKLLLVAAEQLTSRGQARLRAGLAGGDPGGEADARTALERHHRWADGVEVPELSRLARTVRVWEGEILWHVTGGCSNGRTEAMNLLIKKVKRVGHGFRNFIDDRLRLLLHCGVAWQTHRTARRRGRATLGDVEPAAVRMCAGWAACAWRRRESSRRGGLTSS